MFRTSIVRSARAMAAHCVRVSLVATARPSPALAARWNSNQAGQADQKQQIKAAIKENDRLQSDWSENVLSYDQLLPKTESPTPDTFLIDVREPDETIQGMIPSAVNVPLSELSSAFALPAVTWKEKFNFEKPGRDQEVIFYCRSGKRSSSAADVAKRNGYTNIHNYKGSWLEWTEKQAAKPQD